MMKTRKTTKVRPAGGTHELVYGIGPQWPEHSPEAGFIVVDAKAGRLMLESLKCKTWGEYARLTGNSLEQLNKEHGEDIKELVESGPVRPDSALDFRSIWGLPYSVVALIDSPEDKAATVLGLALDSDTGTRLGLHMDLYSMGQGTPGGPPASITAERPEAFQRLSDYLNEKGTGRFVFTRDDAFVRACLWWYGL